MPKVHQGDQMATKTMDTAANNRLATYGRNLIDPLSAEALSQRAARVAGRFPHQIA